jgi:hypothetical protein
VLWFAERLPSGRFREVSELPGPAFSYFDDGNAAVTASGTLQPVGS